eukprot:7308183-Prorocentrum_lima.AAC.1
MVLHWAAMGEVIFMVAKSVWAHWWRQGPHFDVMEEIALFAGVTMAAGGCGASLWTQQEGAQAVAETTHGVEDQLLVAIV